MLTEPGRLPRTAGRDRSWTFRQATEWQVLAESGTAALGCPTTTSRRSLLEIADCR
jgi:hypothetical protein